jgi:effector-binding domain-containing protein
MKNEEKKYKVSLSNIKLKSKPKSVYEKGKINNSLKSNLLTYKELVEYLTAPNSQTIAPSIYLNDQRSNKNWLSQQIFMLDFDGGISKTEVKERFEKYGITPNFIYYTFSHTEEKEKFRVVLLMDTEVTDSKIATHIREGLLLMFPEADEKCKDAARMFFGGLYSEECCGCTCFCSE